MQLQLIVALIIIFLIVMFAVQNAVAVSVVFLLWRHRRVAFLCDCCSLRPWNAHRCIDYGPHDVA